MKIIAFGHRKGVGKDTVAKFTHEIIKSHYPSITVARASFAEPIKEIAYNMFYWAGHKKPDHYVHNYEDKNRHLSNGLTPREIWIRLGTLIGREIDPDVWVELLFAKSYTADVLLITDLRFKNEISAIHHRQGYCVKVLRPGYVPTNDIVDCQLDKISYEDFTIVAKNIKELYKEAERLVTDLIMRGL
jgi:hypothetical protein